MKHKTPFQRPGTPQGSVQEILFGLWEGGGRGGKQGRGNTGKLYEQEEKE